MSDSTPPLFIGANSTGEQCTLSFHMANRHGLIAGATGTGKTVTLQAIAEQFSRAGVPVFTADVKGDLSGMARAGVPGTKITERVKDLHLSAYAPRACPVVFWDLEGKRGHPVRTTVSEMGPMLLARLLELSDAQSDLLHLIFKIADDQQMLLIDLKDLTAFCGWAGENAAALKKDYGSVSSSTITSLQRKLVVLGDQGGTTFFGEPALTVDALLRYDMSGAGLVHILDARGLMENPRQYSTFMLWLLSELFEDLPEVGDPEKPRMVFFFDEAHLLFQDAPPALTQKIEQVVRLIRSKGIGVYFITQNPLDLPDTVLGQLGNRVQHALRAFSQRDQKAVKAAAQTFPLNPGLDIESVITTLGVGEALVSCLDEKGIPVPTQKILIAPPESFIGAISDEDRTAQMSRSPYAGKYDTIIDRESAYERLRAPAATVTFPHPAKAPVRPKSDTPRPPAARRSDTLMQSLGKSIARSVGSSLGREVVRGLLGSMLKRSR
ncbi:MAG: helicase HerA-like domain-containing protein [Chthoniobacterales bacterium]